MNFKNEVNRIVKELRMEKLNQSVQRVKYNAFSDKASVYSAKKLGLYNITVREMV
jgi:hypothetical protein